MSDTREFTDQKLKGDPESASEAYRPISLVAIKINMLFTKATVIYVENIDLMGLIQGANHE